MTVKELKEKMDEYSDDAEVLVTSEDGDLYTIDFVGDTNYSENKVYPTIWVK